MKTDDDTVKKLIPSVKALGNFRIRDIMDLVASAMRLQLNYDWTRTELSLLLKGRLISLSMGKMGVLI